MTTQDGDVGQVLPRARLHEARTTRSLFRDLADSFRHPEFWALSSWLDIVVRNRTSSLGPLWLIMPAVLYIFAMAPYIAGMSGASIPKFMVQVGLGWIPFRLAMSSVTDGASAAQEARSFLLDGHTRLTDYALKAVARGVFHFLLAVPFLGLALSFLPGAHWAGLPMSFAGLVLVLINCGWIAVVFTILGARYPDVAQFAGNLSMILFLITPIVWFAGDMPSGSFRAMSMHANPFFHMIEVIRAPLMPAGMAAPHVSTSFWVLAVMAAVGWMLSALIYRRYVRFVPLWV